MGNTLAVVGPRHSINSLRAVHQVVAQRSAHGCPGREERRSQRKLTVESALELAEAAAMHGC
jgi:hypothetical protein